ncbi:MAG: hypothetical protein M1824_006632 [Vezdaea acicularis]|nr:MAG: hypothetical protein M1824_006632 [Vezdaea acicularis]
MDQHRALQALAPYLALSKSATSPRSASELITRATSDPHTYVFGELLNSPQIQALREAEEEQYVAYYRLLEIFCWGTWKDYHETPSLPPLSPPQQTKLRLLTLLSLPPSSRHTYSSLLTLLSLPTPASLESLLTSAIYASLLSARLSPSTSTITISSLSPLRDLAPSSIPTLTATLGAFSARCIDVLADLDHEITKIRTRARDQAERDAALQEKREKALEGVERREEKREGGTNGANTASTGGIGSSQTSQATTADPGKGSGKRTAGGDEGMGEMRGEEEVEGEDWEGRRKNPRRGFGLGRK